MEKKKYLTFEKQSAEFSAILSWWLGLGNAKGERAELRRCKELEEIFFVQSFHKVRGKLLAFGNVSDVRLALTVASLSHVKVNLENISLPRQMASPLKMSTQPRVSELRFRRFIQIKRIEEFFIPIIRLIKMLDSTVDIQSLVQSVYGWNDYVRKQWAFEYYGLVKE